MRKRQRDADVDLILVWHEHGEFPRHPHRHEHPTPTRRIRMATNLNVGQSVDRTATAEYTDPSGAVQTDPNSPSFAWSENSAGAIITLVDHGSAISGISSATYTATGPGDAQVTVTVTDPDGNTAQGVDDVSVSAAIPPPSTDATAVTFA